MAYQSLYRRYRPRRFGELRGQPHVVLALRNAVREDRVGHAYLFSGPRGTGKTSTARILAKVLNCERPVDGEPCCECPSCLAVEAGISFDVHELDAASNNGVDNIRELIERANLATPGRTKVYILDEVHMLSRPAEAALLKTLEEPPPNVVFVLATTDPQKVSPTIRSRCQSLEFHLLASSELAEHVRWVIGDAGLEVDDDAVEAVVRQGRGSARDTLSALDQVVAAGGAAPDVDSLDELVEALAADDAARALAAVAVAVQAGRDPRTLAEHLVAHLRDAFLSLMAPDLVQLPDRTKARVAEQAHRLGPAATVRAIEVLGEVLVELRQSPDPRLLLDVALVRLTTPAADTTPQALLARIERLERQVADGSGTAPPVAPSTAPPSTHAPSGRDQARAALGSRARPAPAASPPEAPAAPAPAPAQATSDAPPAPAPAAAAPAGNDQGEVSRDQLTLAWADQVLPLLKGLPKAMYAAGRWVDGPGGRPALALPNSTHVAKCEPHRPDVEAALAKHFGRPVPVRLVVESGQVAAVAREPAEELIDPADIVDDPAPGRSPLDLVTQAFPGAEMVDES